MSNQINHRAEAERLLDDAGEHWDAKRRGRAEFDLLRAQVHATLAAGTPVADQHLRGALLEARARINEIADERDELHEGVRELVAAWDGGGSATDLREAVAELRDLIAD